MAWGITNARTGLSINTSAALPFTFQYGVANFGDAPSPAAGSIQIKNNTDIRLEDRLVFTLDGVFRFQGWVTDVRRSQSLQGEVIFDCELLGEFGIEGVEKRAWQSYATAGEWAQYIIEIADSVGTTNLTAYAVPAIKSKAEWAAEIVESAGGVMWEGRDESDFGYYRDIKARAAATALEIPAEYVAWLPSIESHLGDRVTFAEVSYGDGTNEAFWIDEAAAITRFGRAETRLTYPDALLRAQTAINARSGEFWQLGAVTILMSEVPAGTLRDNLLALQPNDKVIIEGFPDMYPLNNMPGYIEGMSENVFKVGSEIRHTITLNLSDVRLSNGSVTIGEVPNGFTIGDTPSGLEIRQTITLESLGL